MTTDTLRWRLEHNPELTRECYSQLPLGTGCDCTTCRNYEQLGADAFPPTAHELFDRLGLDYRKPIEIYHNARLDSGLHDYGGWFHFVGTIISGAEALQLRGNEPESYSFHLEPLSEHCALGCSSRLALVRDSFTGHPLVQLEFSIQLPWVISEIEPS